MQARQTSHLPRAPPRLSAKQLKNALMDVDQIWAKSDAIEVVTFCCCSDSGTGSRITSPLSLTYVTRYDSLRYLLLFPISCHTVMVDFLQLRSADLRLDLGRSLTD